MASASEDIKADIHFLKRRLEYKDEKPYILRYVPDSKDFAANNVEFEMRNVSVLDLRGRLDSLSFEKNGIAVMKMEPKMSYKDFSNSAKVEIDYLNHLKEHVRQFLGAKSVTVIPHIVGTAADSGPLGPPELAITMALFKIRKRHPSFPVSTGIQYEYEQPTNIAHVVSKPANRLTQLATGADVSIAEVIRTIRRFSGEEAEDILKGRYEWVNVWKPLNGPLTDWPLAVCDESSVSLDTDLEPVDLVFPDVFSETIQVHHNEKQRWYYLSQQDSTEHLLFRQAHARITERSPCVPHSSFLNPRTKPGEAPRESIEVKLLVRYESINGITSIQTNNVAKLFSRHVVMGPNP